LGSNPFPNIIIVIVIAPFGIAPIIHPSRPSSLLFSILDMCGYLVE